MQNKPKISVIVPVYNVEKYLSRCMESLTSQTYPNLEIICVNDGSTDSSLEILKEFAKKDSRIQIIDKENGGQSTARNAGLDIATGEFVSFVDSDDWIEPDTYNRIAEHIYESDLLVFGTNLVFAEKTHTDEKNDLNYYKIKYSGFYNLTDDIRVDMDVSVWNKIFKMSILKENNIRFADGLHYEDYAFFWCYIFCCNSIYFCTEKLYNYVRRQNSVMDITFAKLSTKTFDHLTIMKVIYDFIKQKGMVDSHREVFTKMFLNCFYFVFNFSTKRNKIKVCEYATKILNDIEVDNDYHNIIKHLRLKKYYKVSTNCYPLFDKVISFHKVNGHRIFYILGIKLAVKKREKLCKSS